jgi:hypothetical protein
MNKFISRKPGLFVPRRQFMPVFLFTAPWSGPEEYSMFPSKKPIRFQISVVFSALVITVALFLSGCQMDDTDAAFVDRQFVPVGVWESHTAYGTDTYTVTRDAVSYSSVSDPASEWDTSWSATIETAVDFSANSGVLIIKISDDNAGYYTPGKYSAVYYSGYSATQIKAADPWVNNGGGYAHVETATLNEALSTFTAGTVGTHVSQWGTYTK